MAVYKAPRMKKILISIVFVLAIIERVFIDLGPNLELITLLMLVSVFYLGKKKAFWITLLIMVLTDIIIGNTNIFIFTWSGFLIPVFILGEIAKKTNVEGLKKIGLGTLGGVSSNLFFYFWTNFGVWLMGTMYPKTLFGLTTSYINGLPFLKMQLTSTLFFVPLGFAIFEAVYLFKKSPNFGKLVLGAR